MAILKQGEAGMKTGELCRQNGISEATYYNWKAKYREMGVTDVQKLKRLEEENSKLKRANGRSDAGQRGAERPALKKLLEPAGKRAAAEIAMQQHGISERRACRFRSGS